MIIPIDEARFAAAGLEYLGGDEVATFTIPPEREGASPVVVKVAVADTGLAFFPQRSSGQKRVLALLGFAVE